MSNDKKPWRSDELNDIVGDNIYHDNLVKIRRSDMSNTTNMTVEDILIVFAHNVYLVKTHEKYDTAVGTAKQALNTHILREFEELIGPNYIVDDYDEFDAKTKDPVLRDEGANHEKELLRDAAQRKYGDMSE